MPSLNLSNDSRSESDGLRQTASWRVMCISPLRGVLDELGPLVGHCMPRAAVSEVARYPDAGDLPRLFGSQPPNLILLDVMSAKEQALSLLGDMAKAAPDSTIIALLGAGDSQLMLRCLRQGATELLVQPFNREQLDAALKKLERTLPKDKLSNKPAAKIICVMPAKGACGATTVATNLAFHAKRTGSERVLLADLDPLTGTVSFLLKVKSTYSFLDVLAHSESLDADLWKAMVVQRQGVDVLLSPETLFEFASDLRDASPVINFARANYDVVVLDSPSVYGEWNMSQARMADEVILVTTNELPALQATQRALSYLEANRIGRWKTRVVVNRYDKDVGLSRDVIGTALHTDIFHVIPSDYEAVQRALLEGKSVPPTSGLGKSFTQLGDRLTGKKKEPAKTGSAFGSLLSLFSRTSS